MKNVFVKITSPIVLCIILFLSACDNVQPYEEEPHPIPTDSLPKLGLMKDSQERVEKISMLSAPAMGQLPTHVDLSPDMPPPGNQGAIGSCVGWAIGYSLKSYHEKTERGYDYLSGNQLDYRHIMSPSYIYNQIYIEDCMKGSYFVDALEIIKNQGISTWDSFPYEDRNCETQPGSSVISEAGNHKIANYYRINHKKVADLKSYLFDGIPIIIGIPVDEGFSRAIPEENENTYIWKSTVGNIRGNHAMTVVGYDDSKNAFKVMNSWGDTWANGGFAWIDYDYFTSNVYVAFITEDELKKPGHIQINQISAGQQKNPHVARASDGTFAVVWEDDSDGNSYYQILLAIFSASGEKIAGDIVVNTEASGQQRRPKIAISDNGHIVVVWEDDKDQNGYREIMAAGFDLSGNKTIKDFSVNQAFGHEQRRPDIDMNASGVFVISWEDDQDGNGYYQIMAAGFNSNGSRRFNDITVNQQHQGQQFYPSVAVSDNAFFVAFQDDQDMNNVFQIMASAFSLMGKRMINDITVNQKANGQQIKPSIDAARDGNFVVSWQDDQDGNGYYEILAAGFDASGKRRFNDVTVNQDYSGQQLNPHIAVSSNGQFVVTWEDDTDMNKIYQIKASGMTRSGARRFSDITVNLIANGHQLKPVVAMDGRQNIVVVWEDDANENNIYEILGRIMGPDGK